MGRLRWPLLILVICLPVAVLAAGYEIPWLSGRQPAATPLPVPTGDRELVWLHTTTNASTWERFVTGVRRSASDVPGLWVDDSQAFLDQTTDVPEVVIGHDQFPGKLRVRWYKLNSYAKTSQWVDALAARNPAPLAIIGGGSSDRARDLAQALARQTRWFGDRPLFFVTTATAEKVHELDDAEPADDSRELLGLYPGRTFRFCFGNRQMAESMLDFVWQHPELRPEPVADVLPMAVASTLAVRRRPLAPPVFSIDWKDDPYSGDLLDEFHEVLRAASGPNDPPPDVVRLAVPFSVGGYYLPNRVEAEVADSIQRDLRRMPGRRALLVIPTIPAPARRMLRTLCDANPRFGEQVVALNGDGIQVNTVLRDGEFAWPVQGMPVPLVMFTHNDPLGWDAELTGPSSTEDVLHFANLMRVACSAAYQSPGLPASADVLAERLRAGKPAFFDPNGRRLSGTGEYVVLLKPLAFDPAEVRPDANLEVWRRTPAGHWQMTRRHPIHQSRAGGR